MTSGEFRRNSTLVQGMREIVHSEIFQAALEVLENESCLSSPDHVSEARQLGRVEGENKFLKKLLSLGTAKADQSVDNEQVV